MTIRASRQGVGHNCRADREGCGLEAQGRPCAVSAPQDPFVPPRADGQQELQLQARAPFISYGACCFRTSSAHSSVTANSPSKVNIRRSAIHIAVQLRRNRGQFDEELSSSELSGPLLKRSGDIFGILEQMKETFTTSLSAERGEEKTAVSDFEALKAGKMKEINARKEQVLCQNSE